MDSKILEEVKKRRGKPSAVNIYQKLILLVGAAALVYAIWINPACLPAVEVIGTTALIFFVLKDSKEKQDVGRKVDSLENHSETKDGVTLGEVPSAVVGNSILGEVPPGGKMDVDLQEILSALEEKEGPEKVV